MVMTSHQIGALAMQQQAMFSGMASYAQQITPPYAMQPGAQGIQGPLAGGYTAGPPPAPPMPMAPPASGMGWGGYGGLGSMALRAPYAAPGAGVQQALGEQLAGTGLSALSTFGAGAANVAGMAGLAGAGMGMLGMGGTAGRVMAGIGGFAPLMAMEAANFGTQQLYAGFQERQALNRVLRQRFGGMMGVGQGRGGLGFGTSEMGDISEMVRNIAAQDMFTDFNELTRVMDRTSQMGLYRGIQSAREFRDRFRETVSTLREVARTMHVSLEEATSFVEQQRGMGFFTGQEINANLMRTRLMAGATGMSVGQLQQIGMQGTQMGRMMGMRGRVGAQAMQESAANLAMGMQMGVLTDEMVAEATGGLTGAEGAQALAGRMMQVNQRWLRRGAGRVMTAALWDPETGGINQELLGRMMGGGITFQQLRATARENIGQSGGRRSEFFRDEERVRGQLMAEGGQPLMLAMLEQHFGARRGLTLEDPIMQRYLRRSLGVSQAEVEVMVRQMREAPRVAQERASRMRQQLENEARNRAMEGMGFLGFRRRLAHRWEQDVERPLREAGEGVVQSLTQVIDDIARDMEGTISTHMTDRTKRALQEFAATGRTDYFLSPQEMRRIQGTLDYDRAFDEMQGGFFGRLGRGLGIRGETQTQRLTRMGAALMGAEFTGLGRDPRSGGTIAARAAFINQFTRQVAATPTQMGFDAKEIMRMGASARALVMSTVGTGAGLEEWRQRRAAAQGGTAAGASAAHGLAQERIELYSSRDPATRAAFAKLSTIGEKYGLLRNIEESGFGRGSAFAAPINELVGGRDVTVFGMELSAIRGRQKELLGEIGAALASSAPGEMPRLGGRAYGGAVVSGGGRRGMGPDITAAGVQELLGNEKMREFIFGATRGNETSLRALQDVVGLTSQEELGRWEIGKREQRVLGELLQQLTGRDRRVKQSLLEYMQGMSYEQQVISINREREIGQEFATFLTNNESIAEAASRAGPEAYEELQEIARLRSTATPDTWREARDRELAFYAKYGGDPKAMALAGELTREGGAGTYMGVGLMEARRITQQVGARRGGKLAGLFAVGIGGVGALQLQGRRFRGKRGERRFLKMVKEGMGMEQLMELVSPEVREQMETEPALRQRVGEILDIGRMEPGERAAVTGEELAGFAGARGAERAAQARAQGVPEDIRSLNRLAEQQVTHLKDILEAQRGTKNLVGQLVDRRNDELGIIGRIFSPGGSDGGKEGT